MTRASCQYSTPTPKWQERPATTLCRPYPFTSLPFFPSAAAVVGSFFGTMPNLAHCVVRSRAGEPTTAHSAIAKEGALAAISSDRSHTIELL
jgi:hypothetical protein